MDAKIGLMTGAVVATAIDMKIGNTRIAVLETAVTDAGMTTAVAGVERMMHPDISAAGEVLTTVRVICVVAGERMMALATSVGVVDAMTRPAMIAADAHAIVVKAATMIDAAMTGPIAIAGEEAIQTIWRIASMTAIQPPTPLARVAGVGAVEAAVAEETTVPQATEPAGSRAAPAWCNQAGAVLP